MAIKAAREEIERFMSNKDPEVLCITGKWGVGKTYAWKYFLQEAVKKNQLGFSKCSYVSLFGLNNLEDVRYAIFRETQDNNSKSNSLFSFARKTADIVPDIPIKGINIEKKFFNKVFFYLVRNQIVCIDDLERAGEGLRLKDILGLVSFLKEQRNCKIAILLNDEKLNDNEDKEFKELLEKVIDTKVTFSPTPQESADIVFQRPSMNKKLIHDNSITLGIINIRIIKKIERIVSRFEEVFGADSPLMNQIVHSASLFIWSTFQPDQAPSIKFITDFSRVHGIGFSDEKISEQERDWRELMRKYRYTDTDDFDLKILETIQNGYFDKDSLKEYGDKQLELIRTEDKRRKFSEAWNIYHDSFDDNKEEFLKSLYESAIEAAKYIEPHNIDSTVIILKRFGKITEAKDLIEKYISARSEEKELFSFERSLFSRDIKDTDLIAAFKEKRDSFVDSRDPAEILSKIYINQGWNQDDIVLLNKLTTDDFYQIFKKNRGRDLDNIINGSLEFRRLKDASEDQKEITKKAVIALEIIGKENDFNKMRVEKYGIEIKSNSEK
jgi:hypothetical protein